MRCPHCTNGVYGTAKCVRFIHVCRSVPVLECAKRRVPLWCTICHKGSLCLCALDSGSCVIVSFVLHSLQNAEMSGVVAKRMLRVETNFEEILEDYLSTRLPVVGGGGY